MLKLVRPTQKPLGLRPAAFRRLCVETINIQPAGSRRYPAAFRRLCVETSILKGCDSLLRNQPPSGGCVLKLLSFGSFHTNSHPAAFRRLCAETELGFVKLEMVYEPAAFRRLCVETV